MVVHKRSIPPLSSPRYPNNSPVLLHYICCLLAACLLAAASCCRRRFHGLSIEPGRAYQCCSTFHKSAYTTRRNETTQLSTPNESEKSRQICAASKKSPTSPALTPFAVWWDTAISLATIRFTNALAFKPPSACVSLRGAKSVLIVAGVVDRALSNCTRWSVGFIGWRLFSHVFFDDLVSVYCS